jgi:quinol monooxygenase YgiN
MAGMLTVVATLRAKKDRGDALAALLIEQAVAVRRAEPGCIAYRVHRSAQDPDVFLFYEAYVNDAAFDFHRGSAHLAAFRDRREREGLTAGPAVVDIYRSLTN